MTTANLKAIATGAAERPQKTIFQYLDDPRVQKGLAAVAGKILNPDRLLKLCINAVKKTPRLLECDPQTVLGAMMTSAALGLEPNTVQQQAFLIPYKKRVKLPNGQWADAFDCQFQIGARGFVTLAYRSPRIRSIEAEAIHAGDRFEQLAGSQSFLRYSKALVNRGDLVGAFSYVRLEDGGEVACVLPLEEIEKIRSKSETWRALVRGVETAENDQARAKAQTKLDETPWVMWADDMAAKSAIKKHAKQLPVSSSDNLLAAAEIDNHGETATIDLKAMADPDVARAAVSDVADGGNLPALEHNPSDAADFGDDDTPQRETIVVSSSAGAADRETGEILPPVRAAANKAGPPAKSYAQWADNITRATGAEAAALALDEARDTLPADQHAELSAHWSRTWGDK